MKKHYHEPSNYQCPFCRVVKGIEDQFVYTKQQDTIYRDKNVTAFIASHWWPNNKGHVIIIPNQHIENIYALPDRLSHKIHSLERKIALALKRAYKCGGVSSRQHNEPAGGQDVWHFHLHIFPRYTNDHLYELDKQRSLSAPKDRKVFATRLIKILHTIS